MSMELQNLGLSIFVDERIERLDLEFCIHLFFLVYAHVSFSYWWEQNS
jgi:hypothetical protein